MFIRFSKRRWSDKHNYQLWPFTFCFSNYRTIGLILDSGSVEHENPGCHLRLHLFGFTVIMELPPVIMPWRSVKIKADWDAATVARLGRDWYQHEYPREYGLSLSTDGFLQVFLGAQTHSSDTTQSWSCFLPFTQWRHVRYSLYDLQGNHFWTEPNGMPWDERQVNVNACPSITFAFEDFDGERIEACTKIEEREWRFGDKQFKWLSMFRKPKISRSLDINFSKETGPKKGSWKGGTVGHGIEMLPGELHESAFKRYCAEHKMKFLGLAP